MAAFPSNATLGAASAGHSSSETVFDDCGYYDYDESYYDYDYESNPNDTVLLEALISAPEVSSDQYIYNVVHYYSTHVVLPIIFILGILGNAINIAIFTRSRFRRALDEIEKSAATGLVSLATSDLAFCLVGLLASIVSMPIRVEGLTWWQTAALYVDAYKAPVLNLFTFSSTWLVVAVAFERYVAVVYPFRARSLIRVRRTIIVDIVIYLVAIAFSVPGFTKYTIQRITCRDGSVRHLAHLNIDYFKIRQGYLITWAVVGTFLPLCMLVIFNFRLVRKIHQSKARCTASTNGVNGVTSGMDTLQYSASKITTILITIVVLHVTLVSPSMILSFLHLLPEVLAPSSGSGLYFRMRTATVLANVAAAANFAVNFLLYCALSRPFRDHLTGNACKRSPSSRASTDTTGHRYHLVEVHVWGMPAWRRLLPFASRSLKNGGSSPV